MELLLEAYKKCETNAAFRAERHWAGPGDSGDHSSGDWVPHRGCDRSPLRAGEVFPPPGRLAPAVRPRCIRPARRTLGPQGRAREPPFDQRARPPLPAREAAPGTKARARPKASPDRKSVV